MEILQDITSTPVSPTKSFEQCCFPDGDPGRASFRRPGHPGVPDGQHGVRPAGEPDVQCRRAIHRQRAQEDAQDEDVHHYGGRLQRSVSVTSVKSVLIICTQAFNNNKLAFS